MLPTSPLALAAILSSGAFVLAPITPLAPSPALAQPPASTFNAVTNKPLADALNESIAKGRLLVVLVSPDAARSKKNLAAFNNPALDAWARAHAVVVNVTDREIIKRLIEWELSPTEPEAPHVFRDGKKIRLFGSAVKGVGSRIRTTPREAPKWSEAEPNASIRLLMKLEWTLRAGQPADPDFLKRHLALNPVAPPPAATAFAPLAADGVEPFVPAAGAAPEPLELLHQARRAFMQEKNLPKATGIYTYLWEMGDTLNPTATPLLFYAAGPDMLDLAKAHAPAKARFMQMRTDQAALIPAMDHADFFKWLLLSRVVDGQLEPLDFLDSALSDPDGALMIEPGERAVLEILLPRVNWADPLKLPLSDDPARYLAGLQKRRGSSHPRNGTTVDHATFDSFCSFLIEVETPRLHAALLRAGRADDAFALLPASTPSATRAAAVALALAQETIDPRHTPLLDAAAEKTWPGLIARLKEHAQKKDKR